MTRCALTQHGGAPGLIWWVDVHRGPDRQPENRYTGDVSLFSSSVDDMVLDKLHLHPQHRVFTTWILFFGNIL